MSLSGKAGKAHPALLEKCIHRHRFAPSEKYTNTTVKGRHAY